MQVTIGYQGLKLTSNEGNHIPCIFVGNLETFGVVQTGMLKLKVFFRLIPINLWIYCKFYIEKNQNKTKTISPAKFSCAGA